jgi:hypothetical protein
VFPNHQRSLVGIGIPGEVLDDCRHHAGQTTDVGRAPR